MDKLIKQLIDEIAKSSKKTLAQMDLKEIPEISKVKHLNQLAAWAARLGYPELIHLALDNGAKLEQKDIEQLAMHALRYKSIPMAEIAADLGWDKDMDIADDRAGLDSENIDWQIKKCKNNKTSNIDFYIWLRDKFNIVPLGSLRDI